MRVLSRQSHLDALHQATCFGGVLVHIALRSTLLQHFIHDSLDLFLSFLILLFFLFLFGCHLGLHLENLALLLVNRLKLLAVLFDRFVLCDHLVDYVR